jgi:4-hydroxy-tetrahydrodipicolinate reductase
MAMEQPIRVVQYGVGPIGLEVARAALKKQTTGKLQLVGAVDIDPAKAGRDLGELLGADAAGIVVSDDIGGTLETTRPDVVMHTTQSFIDLVEDQLLSCVENGCHVVSSTEELSYPFERAPEITFRLDEACKKHGRVIIGTGVNPGYAMDVLAVAATGVCLEVQKVDVFRVVNAGKRRGPLQRKIGAGLTEVEFEKKKATGRFGHIGLRESMYLIADALDWKPDRITETLDPVFADEAVDTGLVQVEAGRVSGIHQEVVAYVGGEPVIRLDLKMAVSNKESFDRVVITGDPPMNLAVEGGIFGDSATVAAVINAIPMAMTASPGIRKVTDLPVPRSFAVQVS